MTQRDRWSQVATRSLLVMQVKYNLTWTLFSEESGVSVHQVLPGICKTKIYRHMPFQQSTFIAVSFAPILWFLMKAPEDGAQTVLYAALSDLAGKTSGLIYKLV